MTKDTTNDIERAIRETLISPNESDRNMEPANVVDGLFAIARALNHVAEALHRLGLNEAATPMGALELLSKEIQEGTERIADALGNQDVNIDPEDWTGKS